MSFIRVFNWKLILLTLHECLAWFAVMTCKLNAITQLLCIFALVSIIDLLIAEFAFKKIAYCIIDQC